MRDNYFAGVRYGQCDVDKLVNSAVVIPDRGQTFLGIHENGRFALEQMILAKWHMTQQVYAHRVRLITDTMIVRGLNLSINDGNANVKAVYAYDGSSDFTETYLSSDDDTLSKSVVESGGRGGAIFGRLRNRDLFKEIAVVSLSEAAPADARNLIALKRLKDDSRGLGDREETIAKMLKIEPWAVIVYPKKIKNPAYSATGKVDPEAILVRTRDGSVRSLDAYEDLLSLRQDVFGTERLHVIAPTRDRRGEGVRSESGKRKIMAILTD